MCIFFQSLFLLKKIMEEKFGPLFCCFLLSSILFWRCNERSLISPNLQTLFVCLSCNLKSSFHFNLSIWNIQIQMKIMMMLEKHHPRSIVIEHRYFTVMFACNKPNVVTFTLCFFFFVCLYFKSKVCLKLPAPKTSSDSRAK